MVLTTFAVYLQKCKLILWMRHLTVVFHVPPCARAHACARGCQSASVSALVPVPVPALVPVPLPVPVPVLAQYIY